MLWPWGTVGYAVVALVWCRMLAGWIAWDGEQHRTSPDPDWGIGIPFGMAGAAIWPVTITLCLVWWLCTATSARWPLVVGSERARRRYEREQKAAQLEQRSRDLEREAGIQ
jgi:hypothetical protein